MAVYRDYKDLAACVNIDSIMQVRNVPFVKEESENPEKESLLSIIFGINPDTGLPSTDIGAVLNKHLAPEVLQFIKDNLMADVSASAADVVRDGISDDTAFALMRNQGETRDSYLSRVRNFMDNEQRSISAMRDLQKKQSAGLSDDKEKHTP